MKEYANAPIGSLICVGARFDDRIKGKVSGFSPRSKKIHLDIDSSSFNKSVSVDLTVQRFRGYFKIN